MSQQWFTNIRANLLADLQRNPSLFTDNYDRLGVIEAVKIARIGQLTVYGGYKVPHTWEMHSPVILRLQTVGNTANGFITILYVPSHTLRVYPISTGPAGWAFNGVSYEGFRPFGFGMRIYINATLIEPSIKELAKASCIGGFLWENATKKGLADILEAETQ